MGAQSVVRERAFRRRMTALMERDDRAWWRHEEVAAAVGEVVGVVGHGRGVGVVGRREKSGIVVPVVVSVGEVGEGKRFRRTRLSLLPGLVSSAAWWLPLAKASVGDLGLLFSLWKEERRSLEGPLLTLVLVLLLLLLRRKPEDTLRDGVTDGRGLSTGEILELAERSSNMCAADLGRESEISSRPAPVLIPRRISSALGRSIGSRARRR